MHPDDALRSPGLELLLDEVELARAARFVRPVDRHRFVLGAGIVRTAVGERLGVPPADVLLDRTCDTCGGPHGPVRLRAGAVSADPVHVSVSHAGDWVGVALAAVPVGLDVERVDPAVDVVELATQVLAPSERVWLDALPDGARATAFFRAWTRKEAVLKSTGRGLRDPMSELVVVRAGDHAERQPAQRRPTPGTALLDLLDRTGHVAALAAVTGRAVSVAEHPASDLPGWPHP